MDCEVIITKLFDLGGIIAGGAAVAQLYKNSKIKDLDFFFSHQANFKEAEKYRSRKLDIVYYQSRNPWDGFDLSISQCSLNRDGKLNLSKACLETYQTGTIKIIKKNLFFPHGTMRRISRYRHRYGLKIDPEDLSYLKGLLYEQVY